MGYKLVNDIYNNQIESIYQESRDVQINHYYDIYIEYRHR